MIGRTLSQYRITASIGAGGMGEVYRATDTRLGRDVAVKVLPAATASDPDRRKRFELEARAASALNHPNILTVYDVGEAEGTVYLAT
jgi:serine/threonine protein kinase